MVFLSRTMTNIADIIYTKNWSPDVKEVWAFPLINQDMSDTNIKGSSDDGKALNFAQFRTLLVQLRSEISDRQLLSQSAVVAPADAEGRAGQVAHTSYWTGVQTGKSVTGTIVSVLKVDWAPGSGKEQGTRTVKTESFVISVA
jgi:hypothetical protein